MLSADLLFIIDDMTIGGAQRSLLSLLHELEHYPVRVDLLILNKSGRFLEYIPPRVRVLPVTSYFADFFLPLPASPARLCQRGQPRLAARRAYLAIASRWHNDRSGYYRATNLVKPHGLRARYTAVISCHYLASLYYAVTKIRAMKKFHWWHHGSLEGTESLREFINGCFESINGIFAVAEGHRSVLQNGFPEHGSKMLVLPNLVAISEIRKKAEAPVPAQISSPAATTIVSMGRLSTEKGFQIALQACRRLAEARLNFKWYVVGEGPERSKLEQSIRCHHLHESFVLLGELSNPFPVLKMADIVVHPSLIESYGYTIAEAHALSKAVIAADTPGARAQIVDGETGLIVAPDPGKVCEAILALIKNPDYRFRLGENGGAKVQESSAILHRFFNVVLSSNETFGD